MKKILSLGFIAATTLIFTSCNHGDDYSQTSNLAIPAFNLFTSVSGNDDPFVGSGTYSFGTKYPEATLTVSANGMTTPSGSLATFSTVPMAFTAKVYTDNEVAFEDVTFKSEDPSSSGNKIFNLTGNISQYLNYPINFNDVDYLPGYKWLVPTSSFHYVFMQYQYGNNWNVRTFWPDLTYVGQTVTTFPQDPGSFNSNEIQYRVIMQLNKDEFSLNKKVDIVMYNAQFAPQAPMIKVILLRDLDIEFTNDGYTISGQNVVPFMVESGDYLPVERFMFNNFEATVGGDLTGISISYTVAGVYKGGFTGTCFRKK